MVISQVTLYLHTLRTTIATWGPASAMNTIEDLMREDDDEPSDVDLDDPADDDDDLGTHGEIPTVSSSLSLCVCLSEFMVI